MSVILELIQIHLTINIISDQTFINNKTLFQEAFNIEYINAIPINECSDELFITILHIAFSLEDPDILTGIYERFDQKHPLQIHLF